MSRSYRNAFSIFIPFTSRVAIPVSVCELHYVHSHSRGILKSNGNRDFPISSVGLFCRTLSRSRENWPWIESAFFLSVSFCLRIDSVMRPRSSSRQRNTSASVTVTLFDIMYIQLYVISAMNVVEYVWLWCEHNLCFVVCQLLSNPLTG